MFTAAQTILVTGASSGIGKAIASLCVDKGATVIACGRNQERLEEARNECGKPERWINAPRDLLHDMEELPAWVKSLAKEYGRLWGLAHCAGIAIMNSLRTYDLNQSRLIFDMNFNAPMLLAKGFADRRSHQKGGAMLFMASAAGVFPEKGHLLYGATKAALMAAARSISQETALYGLRCHCLAPGIVDTPMEVAAEAFMGPKYREEQLAAYPFGFGKPEDIAEMAVFLLSDKARWITGQNFVLAGGRY